MKVKATIGFSGAVSMGIGEVRELPENEVLADLLRAGYVIEVTGKPNALKTPAKKKSAKKAG